MKLLRKILFAFSLLFGGVAALRNWLYDRGWLKGKAYDVPVICVGNLSTGGTGKSPMIEFLISFLKDNHKIAVLSRGYKRKTSGFREVSKNSTVAEVGDEPLQFKKKFPEITVAVCEDRQTGIEKLRNTSEIILLDDAFQHRKVKASLNILLTPFDDLYVDDFMLPTGNLREPKWGAKRADVIVVTKCPETIDASKAEVIIEKLKPKPHQQVYFSKIDYAAEIKSNSETIPLDYLLGKQFLLVTGIANPKPLVHFLNGKGLDFEERSFPDHHNFTATEMEALKSHRLILTTEKDFMRLRPISHTAEIYYLPIKTIFLNGAEADLRKRIMQEINAAQ